MKKTGCNPLHHAFFNSYSIKNSSSNNELIFLLNGISGRKNTITLFLEKDVLDDMSTFVGKVNIYDHFVTKELLTLNVLVEKRYCKAQKKSTILFRFSPKGFEHDVWQRLKELKLKANICDI